jgi:hypothetical protein
MGQVEGLVVAMAGIVGERGREGQSEARLSRSGMSGVECSSMSRISEAQRTKWNWVRLPFFRCLDYVGEADRILHLSMDGISGVRRLFKAQKILAEVEDRGEQIGQADDTEKRLQRAKRLSDLAATEIENDFPLLHAHTLVALWGALDALIDDVLVTWFVNDPSSLNEQPLRRIRIPLAVYESLDKPDRMRLLVDELKRQTEARYKPGVAGFEELLGVIGLSGSMDDVLKKPLIEMRELRNVLVHNAGIVDRRLVERCPWETWKTGDKVIVTHARYLAFRDAHLGYVITLIDRSRSLLGLPPIESDDESVKG